VSGLLGGRAGSIDVNAGELIISDGAQIGSQTFGSSPGGDITVNAGNVLITGADTAHGVPSAILAGASALPGFPEFATGKGGNIVFVAIMWSYPTEARFQPTRVGLGTVGVSLLRLVVQRCEVRALK
jgi:large exoprotein involved in heme utilization and adhesion